MAEKKSITQTREYQRAYAELRQDTKRPGNDRPTGKRAGRKARAAGRGLKKKGDAS